MNHQIRGLGCYALLEYGYFRVAQKLSSLRFEIERENDGNFKAQLAHSESLLKEIKCLSEGKKVLQGPEELNDNTTSALDDYIAIGQKLEDVVIKGLRHIEAELKTYPSFNSDALAFTKSKTKRLSLECQKLIDKATEIYPSVQELTVKAAAKVFPEGIDVGQLSVFSFLRQLRITDCVKVLAFMFSLCAACAVAGYHFRGIFQLESAQPHYSTKVSLGEESQRMSIPLVKSIDGDYSIRAWLNEEPLKVLRTTKRSFEVELPGIGAEEEAERTVFWIIFPSD